MEKVDLRIPNPLRRLEDERTTRVLYEFNQVLPGSQKARDLARELFIGGYGEGTKVLSPLYVNLAANIHLGRNVRIMPYFKCMSAGQVYIGDNVQIAMNVSILTNGHDFYERDVLTVEDVHIHEGVWIGAGATILPGITIHKNAVIGAASVVTHDVEANTVVAGNPARVIRKLDPAKFLKKEAYEQ